MGEKEGCGNRKSDVASLERKLKLHLLVYTSRKPVWCTGKLLNIIFIKKKKKWIQINWKSHKEGLPPQDFLHYFNANVGYQGKYTK